MNIKNLVLQKNEKFEVGGNKPYFRLCVPPEQEGGKWIDLGAFWRKEKNGKVYYSGSISKDYTLESEFIGELPVDPLAEDDSVEID